MYNRLEFTFQPVIFLLSLPMAAHETGHGAEMGRAFPMGAVPESASKIEASKRDTLSATQRKVHPGIPPRNGTQFPNGRCFGKRVPEFRLKTGCGFPTAIEAETASQNSPPEWDALSG